MKFTVCFPSSEVEDHSYGLVWIPGPCWIKSGGKTAEPHDDMLVNMCNVHFSEADAVARLLKAVPALPRPGERPSLSSDVVIVVHPVGHGRSDDLRILQRDLAAHGYRPVVIQPTAEL